MLRRWLGPVSLQLGTVSSFEMLWLVVSGFLAYLVYRYFYNTPDTSETETDRGTADAPLRRMRSKTILPTVPPPSLETTTTYSPRDQIAVTVESLDWCNDIMKICWPYIGKITQSMLGPTVEPLINLSLPKGMKNFQFVRKELGKDPVCVDRVSVHKRHYNSVALDLDVTFVGTPNLEMKVFPVPNTFGIRELRWSGRLSILLRPLITTIPLVGAVQASMVTHPDLEIDFTGIAQVADLGPVARAVRNVMRQVIASMMVMPNRYVFKMVDTVDFFDIYYPPIGAIHVTFKNGRGFGKEKRIGFIKSVPDIYMKGKFGLEKFRTPHVNNSLTPEWNVGHTFVVNDLDQPLDVKFMDKDAAFDDILGERTLLARELLRAEQQWVKPNRNVNAEVAGKAEVLVETILYKFTKPSETLSNSQCMVSVLVDCASNLSADSTYTLCKILVGGAVVGETVAVSKIDSDLPLPGYDPCNPTWAKGVDVICKSPSEADVTLEVYDNRRMLGKFAFNAAEVQQEPGKEKGGAFPIGNGATLRAKVIMRGLVKDTIVP